MQIEGNIQLTILKGADKSAPLARGCLRCAQIFCIQILGGVQVSTVLVICTVVIMTYRLPFFFHYHLKHAATQCVYVYNLVMQLLNFPAYSRSSIIRLSLGQL